MGGWRVFESRITRNIWDCAEWENAFALNTVSRKSGFFVPQNDRGQAGSLHHNLGC